MLEEVVSFIYLVVFIDKHLNFDLHIELVGKKLAKFNGMLFRAKNFLSKTFLLQMYKSYAKPMISYGILAYGSTKKTKLSSIFCIQKRMIFLDIDSNRPNTRASIKSLIPLPKVKTQTQKKSLRFSIIKMFNYFAKESLLPKQAAKKEIFSIRTKLRAYYLDNKDVFDMLY